MRVTHHKYNDVVSDSVGTYQRKLEASGTGRTYTLGYLRKVARNASLDALSKSSRERGTDPEVLSDLLSENLSLPSSTNGSEEMLQGAFLLVKVLPEALSELRENDLEFLTLLVVTHDFNYDLVALECGVSTGAVRSKFTRLTHKIYTALELKSCEGPSNVLLTTLRNRKCKPGSVVRGLLRMALRVGDWFNQ